MHAVYLPDAGLFEIQDNSGYQIPTNTGLRSMPSCVEDGDSVVFRGEKWRIFGLDAPEIAKGHYHCDEEFQRGVAAGERLSWLLIDAVKRDALVWKITRNIDVHNRRLVYAFIDGVNVADIMIEEGHAHPYDGKGAKVPHCECASAWLKHDMKDQHRSHMAELTKARKRAALPQVAGIIVS
jgi:endonuclease YncB( thermonuclease family)